MKVVKVLKRAFSLTNATGLNVPDLSKTKAKWRDICLPIMEARCTSVQTARSFLIKQDFWRGTWSLTEKKEHTIVSNKSFGHARNLKKHLLTHRRVKTHTCSDCKKSFGLEDAHDHPHWGENTRMCRMPRESFGRAGAFNRHKLTHNGEKPNKWTQCDFASSNSGHLSRHIKAHSLKKPNQYKWCDYSSITKSDFIKHVLTHSRE